MDELFLLSYLYVCVWKTVGRINEEFLHYMLIAINLALSLYMSSAVMHSEQHLSLQQYQFCVSINHNDTDPHPLSESKFNLINIMMSVSAMFCTLLLCLIWLDIHRSSNQVEVLHANVQTTGDSLEILRISQISFGLTIIHAIPSILMPYLDDALNANCHHESLIQQGITVTSFFGMFVLSFIFPLLSIYSRKSLKEKFTRICKQIMEKPYEYFINAS